MAELTEGDVPSFIPNNGMQCNSTQNHLRVHMEGDQALTNAEMVSPPMSISPQFIHAIYFLTFIYCYIQSSKDLENVCWFFKG